MTSYYSQLYCWNCSYNFCFEVYCTTIFCISVHTSSSYSLVLSHEGHVEILVVLGAYTLQSVHARGHQRTNLHRPRISALRPSAGRPLRSSPATRRAPSQPEKSPKLASQRPDAGGDRVRPGAHVGVAPVPAAPAALPLLRGHAGRPAPPRTSKRRQWPGVEGPAPLPRAPAAAVPGAPSPAAAHRAGAARAERGERGRERLHARARPAHRPHPQGPPRRRGLRPPPPPPLLRRKRQRRLEGLLLRVPVPAHPRDAPRHRPRLRRPPHRRRTRGAPPPRAGFRELPGPGEDACGEGGAAEVRPVLLPLPGRRVGGGRVRPHHGLPRDPARRHRHRPLPAALAAGLAGGPGDEPGAGVARAHAAGVPHAVVQVDGAPIRGPRQLRQWRRARHADRGRRQVQPPWPPLRRRAQGVWPHRRDDRRPAVAEHRQARRAQLQLHHQRALLLHALQLAGLL